MNLHLPALPPLLTEVAEISDRSTALHIALKAGGQQVYVPQPERVPGSALARLVGEPAALTLSRIRPTENLPIPVATRPLIHHLRYDRGLSVNKIAAELRASTSTVKRALREMEMAGRQLGLFGTD